MKYIFDLDNTLIYSNTANNVAYNNALKSLKLGPIDDCIRITKETLSDYFPNLSATDKDYIVRQKNEAYCPCMTYINQALVNQVALLGPENCVLWTSASKDRVNKLLLYHNLEDRFSFILFSDKSNVLSDVEQLCSVLNCTPEDLQFYDDNKSVINNLLELGCKASLIK